MTMDTPIEKRPVLEVKLPKPTLGCRKGEYWCWEPMSKCVSLGLTAEQAWSQWFSTVQSLFTPEMRDLKPGTQVKFTFSRHLPAGPEAHYHKQWEVPYTNVGGHPYSC